MTETVLRLRAHEVWSALEVIDPVAVLAEDLIGRTVDRPASTRNAGLFQPWHDDAELALLEHPAGTPVCVLPAHSLRAALGAALAAVAARELLASAGVTVAMLGPPETTQPQLTVIARQVPDISHVALCLKGGLPEIDQKLADQLELSGIGLTVVPTLADAVFGANLVIAADDSAIHDDLDSLRLRQLARGTVLVNATGRDLRADLVDGVDQVFVDDLELLADHRDRRVVSTHLAEQDTGGHKIAGDLCQLLTGHHAGRQRADDVVLVELLGVHELNVELAQRLYEGATRTGLGERIAF